MVERFPTCKSIDLYDYMEQNRVPQLIRFGFNLIENLSITLFVEERNKATSTRSLKFQRLIYNGPTIQIADLSKPYTKETVLRKGFILTFLRGGDVELLFSNGI